MNFYVEQDPNYALGNFINCTPTLRFLAKKYGAPVPVLFNTHYVEQCFLDCPFIEHLDAPRGHRLFGSEMINKTSRRPMNQTGVKTLPDYAFIFQQIVGRRWSSQWHTYVDQPGQRTAATLPVIVNGSGNERPGYVESKDVGSEPFLAAGPALFVGSEADLARNAWADTFDVGDIRRSLQHIADAPCVIANDTGLAHAAGAMNKPLLVLWKDTPFPRCSNPGKNTEYAFDHHAHAVTEFLRRNLPGYHGDTSRTSVRYHGTEALEQGPLLRSTSGGTAELHG